jgi:hypothetical protein
MRIKVFSALAAVVLVATIDTVSAFSIPSATSSYSSGKRSAPLFSAPQDADMASTITATATTRANVLKGVAKVGFLTLLPTLPLPAFAKDDPSLKGTKADPEYEACMSTCIYECTKPKGVEQKSRKECIPECKQTCATSKAQLMIGTPIIKK